MNTKVAISGLSGRMGQEFSKLLATAYNVRGKSFVLVAGEPADVWIDFSHPTATEKLLGTAKVPLVIGTTGFTETQLNKIRAYSAKHPVLLAPNMSLGMNVMQNILKSLGDLKTLGFTAVLSETHHRHKKDAPSGTALSLKGTLGQTGFSDIQINVTRAGAEKGLHRVTFYSDEEELSIEHRVVDRSVFAKGALLGAAFLLDQQPGLYSYDDVVKSLIRQ